MPFKLKKIIVRTLAAILILAVTAVAAVYLLIKFYFIPKYNASLGEDAAESELLTDKDLAAYAKYLTDRQVIDNIINFNADSAKDILTAMQEFEEEESESVQKVPDKSVWNRDVVERAEHIPTPAPSPPQKVSEPVKESGKGASSSGKTAYERIMSTASQEEISAGMAILSKVNMGKVNKLRKAGKTSELKAYITSVLTSAEIRKALSLYSKYKHLL